MFFKELASYFEKLEETASRNEMTEILAELFKECSSDEIDKVCYLSLGKLVPQYESYEFNMAEKMMFEVLVKAYGKDKKEVKDLFGKLGDLGKVAQNLSSGQSQEKGLKVVEVFNRLWEIAGIEGGGSVEKKINLLAKLLNQLDPLSAKYTARIPIKKLRLGFSDMTILDALSFMSKGDKSLRKEIEPFYNISADIGKIAKVFKEKGLKGLKGITMIVGTPIRTSAAERLPTAEAILKKIGKCAAEPKYDGFRVQVHKNDQEIEIFSRNLENMTFMFPEIVNAAQKLSPKKIIFEGEAIGYNPDTGEFLPFQETVQRKRKYEVEEMAKKIPLKVFVFDLLLLENKSYLEKPYFERRKKVGEILSSGKEKTLILAEEKICDSPRDLEKYFSEKVAEGLEGVMVKKLDAPYEAGSRGFSWIKYKREERGSLDDTIDCLILGYYLGRGKRASFGIGALLVGVYDSQKDTFFSIAKIGTGLSDDQWKKIKSQCDKLKVNKKPPRYEVDKDLHPNVWTSPSLVTVVRADEITKSPLHSAGRLKGKVGYALRFPRVIELLRSDKKAEDVTTVDEIIQMYQNQRKG